METKTEHGTRWVTHQCSGADALRVVTRANQRHLEAEGEPLFGEPHTVEDDTFCAVEFYERGTLRIGHGAELASTRWIIEARGEAATAAVLEAIDEVGR